MSKGKIKEYHAQQGYGSIIDEQTGQTLSVYANYIKLLAGDVLKPGQEVEYDIERQRNESWAINVRLLMPEGPHV